MSIFRWRNSNKIDKNWRFYKKNGVFGTRLYLHWRIVWRVRQTRSKLLEEFSLSLWMSPFPFSYFEPYFINQILWKSSFWDDLWFISYESWVMIHEFYENVPWMISVSAIVPRFLVRIFVLIDANFSEVNLSETASICSREITVYLISLFCI